MPSKLPSGSRPWGSANSRCCLESTGGLGWGSAHQRPPHPGIVSCLSVHADTDTHTENVTAGRRGGQHRPQTDVEDHRSQDQWRSKEKHYLDSLLYRLIAVGCSKVARQIPTEAKENRSALKQWTGKPLTCVAVDLLLKFEPGMTVDKTEVVSFTLKWNYDMISKINAIKRTSWFVSPSLSFFFFSEETHSCLTPHCGTGESSKKDKIAHLISLILSVSSVFNCSMAQKHHSSISAVVIRSLKQNLPATKHLKLMKKFLYPLLSCLPL